MKLSTSPLQSSHANGDGISIAPNGRRWGSRPKVHGYSMPFEPLQASFPLTPIQREILHQQPEPQWFTYPLALPSETSPSIDRIQFTWEALAAHNPILTSTLVNLGSSVEEACIVVDNHVQPLHFFEVSGYAPGTRSKTTPPYAVFKVRKTGEPTITLHIPRVLVDETSLYLIQRDFSAFCRGQRFAEHAPYSAYVQDVSGRDPDAARAFWNNVLKGSNQKAPIFHTALPSKDRNRLSASSDSEVLDRLVKFERRTGFKRYTALQAAWALVLLQHQSAESVLFATATRDSLPAIYGGRTAIGCMDVIFPLAVHVKLGTSVHSLLSDIQEACHNGVKQAFIGFKAILEQSPSSSLTVQSCLKFVEDTGDSSFCVDDDDFGLTLRISTTDRVQLTIQYDAGIPDSKIRVLIGHCLSALDHVLRADSEPTMDVRQVDLITATERALILEKALPTHPPREGLIHTLFEEQAVRTPDHVAVQFETGDSMAYLELNHAANKVARQLPCHPGLVVPVYMDRSIELIVSLLAVLKSGAAYVTLDPDFPMERSKIIIEDVGAPFVLTSASLASRFEYPTVILEHMLHGNTTGSHENLNIELSSNHVAYVIYTSGSTGKPKGVLLEHGAAVTGLISAPRVDGLRSLLFYNPVFSAAQRTIFSTLIQGGCLCLASKEALTVALAETIKKMEVNTIGLTASTASLLTQETLPSLKVITVTGEKVGSVMAQGWAEKLKFQVAYGLSECTQLNWRVNVKPGSNPNEVGRPRDTTQAYVLIPGTTRLSPLLVPGELCLGGHQLARGYLNRPEQTAKSFIDNPFHPGRLFRTGDMAVCLENGNIELLGRIDFKVKIAGQQVDPDGVASVLQDSGLVATACVVPITLNEETCLVACILLGPTASWNEELSAKLRSHSQSILPGYSVPSFWIPLEEVPLNANGKVDKIMLRKQLEGMGREGLVRESRFKGPSGDEKLTPTEMSLRKAWADVLNLDVGSIRSSDGFLTLGGSSLHAIMVVTRLYDHGLSVVPADIIRSPSLRELASTLVDVSAEIKTAPERLSLLPASSTFTVDDLADFEDAYSSSALQEALVASSIAGSSDYLYQRVWNIKGVDITRLRKAFEEVYASTDILRTTFMEDGASFLQVVLKSDHPLRWEERYESLADFKALDLSNGIVLGEPFFRVAVLPTQSLLVVTAHHSLFDYWCNQFVYEDVAAVYFGRERSPRPQFKLFVRHMADTRTADTDVFWSRYLENATSCRLGTGTGTKRTITKLVRADFQPVLRSHSLTLASLVYAAWALVLSSRTRSNDVVFATTLSGRDAPIRGIESLNGPTFASVPHRVSVDPSSVVLDYVRAVQNGLWALNMQAKDGMRNALRLSGNDSALFDTLVNVLAKPPSPGSGERPAIGELFSPYGEQPAWSTEYTTLEAVVDDEETILFRLNSDFEAVHAGFILDQVVAAVKVMAAKPNSAISSLSILGQAERSKLLSLSNRIEARSSDLLQARFERVVAATPHRIAVQWQTTGYVSYIELNNRANRLATILRAKGVGPNVCVPLCLEKSVNMVVSIFAVLKAGGAYVPLDPGNPPERNTFITGDVEAKVILCAKEHAQIFIAAGLEVIFVDDLDLSGHCSNHVVPNLKSSDLAYIIYTSGSTGTPKGVMITHGGVSTSINTTIDFLKCGPEWRTLFFSNYVFDASVGDIFNVLGGGGTMCIAPTADLLCDLGYCINSMGVTQVFLTPTVAKLINPDDVPGITTIMLGGEPLTADLVAKWTPRCTVINMYGPTENSIYATMTVVTAGSNTRVIGKPMATVSAAVLAIDGLESVPIGAVGELCLSGPQLARGYLKRDDVTATAFVEWRGERLYRTGDLVRWLPDGQLECFGRKDQQKKLHGHRIELGEIEQAILLTQQVSDCLVAIMETEAKEELVAFCVFTKSSTDVVQVLPAQSHAKDAEILGGKLTTLPPYMVPRVWIPVSSFPLMPSGKADRRKITRLVQDMGTVQLREYSLGGSVQMVTPQTNEEKLLQKVWGELLRVDHGSISAISSFFSMGGDSITAINLVSRCRREGFSISVGDVMAFPVLRNMAKMIKPSDGTGNSGVRQGVLYEPSPGIYEQLAAGGIEPSAIENVTLAVPGQAEFLNRGQTDDQFWQLLAVRLLPADLDFGRWVVLTRQLTERNAILRTMYLRDDRNAWVQVTFKDPVLDLETVEVPDEAAKENVIQDMWEQPFDISKPFVRYRLIVLPDGSRFLAIKLDHAMYDGTLLRIFDSQFVAMAREETVEEAVPFHTFSAHIHSLDKSEPLAFWTELLKDNTFSYPATTHQPRISGMTLRKVDHQVDAFAVRCGSTVSTIFQAAFSILLGRLSNTYNVTYDNLVTGRNVELEDAQMINGTCANFIPFRSSLQPQSTVKSFLKDTQALFWKTTENGSVGLDDIYLALEVDRQASRNKCLFIFQPFEPASAATDHMRWIVMSLSKVTMPIDYALMLEVVKNPVGYTLRIKYDMRIYATDGAEGMGDMLVEIVEGMLDPQTRLEGLLRV